MNLDGEFTDIDPVVDDPFYRSDHDHQMSIYVDVKRCRQFI